MDDRTREALKGSIEKWRKIAANEGVDCGPQNCPLCLLFNFAEEEVNDCAGCPVREKTGRRYCEGTPYDTWTEFGEGIAPPYFEEKLAAARAELAFLESLRP